MIEVIALLGMAAHMPKGVRVVRDPKPEGSDSWTSDQWEAYHAEQRRLRREREEEAKRLRHEAYVTSNNERANEPKLTGKQKRKAEKRARREAKAGDRP